MATLIWRRGLRGLSPAVSPDDFLDEHDRATKIATHKLKPDEEKLGLSALVILYPPPKEPDETPTNHTIIA